MKKLLTYSLLIACAIIVYFIVSDYFAHSTAVYGPLPPPPPLEVEAGPVNVVVDNDTSWIAILKAMVTILGTYLGIRVINKYVKD